MNHKVGMTKCAGKAQRDCTNERRSERAPTNEYNTEALQKTSL